MPRIGEHGWIHSGVKVVDNAAAPTEWTDLDLSSVVGKNRALFFIKFKNRHAANIELYHARSNGETEDVGNSSAMGGVNSMGLVDAGRITHFLMETDSKGIIEWNTDYGRATDVWVLGYIR